MTEPLINYNEALDRLGGDKDFLNELLHELVEQVEQNLNFLKKAIEQQDFQNIKTLSHSLKGASANLNVNRLATHFLKLENLGHINKLDGAEDLLEMVGTDCQELQSFLTNN